MNIVQPTRRYVKPTPPTHATCPKCNCSLQPGQHWRGGSFAMVDECPKCDYWQEPNYSPFTDDEIAAFFLKAEAA